jgi:hypothetical protein
VQLAGSVLLVDRHRGLREASAGWPAASAPDQDRTGRGLAGVAVGSEPEGLHRSGRMRPGFRLRGLVPGAGVLRAGAGTGIGRGRAPAGPPAGSGAWARLGPGVRVHPWPRSSRWTPRPEPRAESWGCGRPKRAVRRCGQAGRSLVGAWRRAWRWRHRVRARCRLGREGWRSPGRSGDLAISRSRHRRRMGGPRRESRVPSWGEGRRAGSGPVPWRRHPPPARKARRVGPRRKRRVGPVEASRDAPGQARPGRPAGRARRDSAPGQRRRGVAAPRRGLAAGRRRGVAAPHGCLAAPRRWVPAAPCRGALAAPQQRGLEAGQ